jgi:hypothetical protein
MNKNEVVKTIILCGCSIVVVVLLTMYIYGGTSHNVLDINIVETEDRITISGPNHAEISLKTSIKDTMDVSYFEGDEHNYILMTFFKEDGAYYKLVGRRVVDGVLLDEDMFRLIHEGGDKYRLVEM